MTRIGKILSALFLLPVLAACAGERPPLHSPYAERHGYGYQDRALAEGRHEIRYVGPVRLLPDYPLDQDRAVEASVREAQELALLRASELAREANAAFLIVDDRRTEVDVRQRVETYFPRYPYGYLYGRRGLHYHRYGYPVFAHPPYYYRSVIGRVVVTIEVSWRQAAGSGALDTAETYARLRQRYALETE